MPCTIDFDDKIQHCEDCQKREPDAWEACMEWHEFLGDLNEMFGEGTVKTYVCGVEVDDETLESLKARPIRQQGGDV
jgi:hypothetical protein